MNAYVVTHWYASNTPDGEGNYVHITGRKPGLVDYLLTLLKLNARVELKVSDAGLIFAENSLFGERNVNTPLAKVTSTVYGWKRPFSEAISLGFVIFCAILSVGVTVAEGILGRTNPFVVFAILVVAGLLGAIIGAVHYRLNRVLTLGVVTECGEIYWLMLKRSLIESVKLDQPLAEEASRIINSLVLERCAGTQTENRAPVAAAAQVRSAVPLPASARAPLAAIPLTGRPATAPSHAPAPVASREPRATCGYCSARAAFPPDMVGQEVPCPTCSNPLLLVES